VTFHSSAGEDFSGWYSVTATVTGEGLAATSGPVPGTT
jgi:hypothetical protein